MNVLLRTMLLSGLLFFFMSSVRAEGLTIAAAINPEGTTAAALSPDGRQIAMIVTNGRGPGVFIAETATGKFKLVTRGRRLFDSSSITFKFPREVRWVTNDLLALDYGFVAESIDLAGKKVATLGAAVIGKIEPGNPASPMMLVYPDRKRRGLARVNAQTGDSDEISLPIKGEVLAWAFDSRGELRAVTMRDATFWGSGTAITNWYRKAGKGLWEKLLESTVTGSYWVPVHVPDEDGKLFVMANDGRDTRAVFSYDVAKRQIGELIVGDPTQDIVQVSGLGSRSLVSVATHGMKPERIWFDPRWKSVQASIDEALPGRVNSISGNPDKMMLVFSYSDVEPGTWYVANMETSEMKLVAQLRPGIDPVKMRPMEVMSYTARDGLNIPAYLTRPEGKTGPQPMIVMIHGGPTVRDAWEWSEDVQLLAAHGYVVFQPQFRGSAGFGRKFLEAGFGQWGLTMQDDVTDGVQHLVNMGIADPDRICIYGASYGGYAALWGLVKTPNLYRCGVSFAGVSDIAYMFEDGSDRSDSRVGMEFMRVRIGDQTFSQAQFDAVSPLKHAARIKAPVLLMHGTADERVPIEHSKKMMTALGAAGKKFEWEEFANEGHGMLYLDSRQKFYERLFAFLHKHMTSK